jgi:predicted metal-dependent phosphoesterase TrpH
MTTPEDYVRRCREMGITCAAVSDHNNVDGAYAVQKIAPFKVIVAEEIRSSEGEIIGLFLQDTIRRGLSPEETVAQIRRQGGLVLVPHPFDRFRRSKISYEALQRIVHDIDIVEVFNSRTTFGRDDERALHFAERYGLLKSAATDSHSPGEIGHAYVEMEDFDGPREFLHNLAAARVVGRHTPWFRHMVSTYAKVRWKLGLHYMNGRPLQTGS